MASEVMVAVARNGGRIARRSPSSRLRHRACASAAAAPWREGPMCSRIRPRVLARAVLQTRRAPDPAARSVRRSGRHRRDVQRPARRSLLRDGTDPVRVGSSVVGMVVLSSVESSIIGRAILGDSPFLRLPAFHVQHVVHTPFSPYSVSLPGRRRRLLRFLYAVEDVCDGPGGVRNGCVLRSEACCSADCCCCCRRCTGSATRCWPGGHRRLRDCLPARPAHRQDAGLQPDDRHRRFGWRLRPKLFCGAMAGAAFGDVVHAIAPHAGGSPGAMRSLEWAPRLRALRGRRSLPW